MTILDLPRETVKMMAEKGLMNKKSTEHWDICDLLKKGHTIEQVAETMRLHEKTIYSVKNTKCSCYYRKF